MKNLNRLQSNANKILQKPDLISLKGGTNDWAYLCRCGFTPEYAGDCFPVVGGTLEEALQYAAGTCHGHGATCNGFSLGCPS